MLAYALCAFKFSQFVDLLPHGKQDGQCTYNLTLGRVRVTVFFCHAKSVSIKKF